MIGILGIAGALLLLMYLAYRGINVLLLAPLLALLAVLLSQDVPLLASYTQVFMKAVGGFIVLYFPLFLLGALFGKLMEASGAAAAIAHWTVARLGRGNAVLAIVLACAVLTYGGVSLFVVAFAVHPIGAHLFRQAGLPKRLIPASIAPLTWHCRSTVSPRCPRCSESGPSSVHWLCPSWRCWRSISGASPMFASRSTTAPAPRCCRSSIPLHWSASAP